MWDEESNLLYLRARYYEPATGRFLSRDSYEGELENPLSKNLYAYVEGNPVNRVDPTGHLSEYQELYNAGLGGRNYNPFFAKMDNIDLSKYGYPDPPNYISDPYQRKGNPTQVTGKDGDKSPIGSTAEFKKKFGYIINEQANELGVDPNLLAAVILVESGGSGFVNGNLKIRFENHAFLNATNKYKELFTYEWRSHRFRTSTNSKWKKVHTGKQNDEYVAFEFAASLNKNAAYESISMGLGQIMGYNHNAAGYSSAKEMYEDFGKGHGQQIKGMITFFKNYRNGSTLRALQHGDLKTFVTQYNGTGQVDAYTKIMMKRMEEYKNAK
jgi:RHS repeat-associated protein